MYLVAALLVFLIIGMWWQRRKISLLEKRLYGLSDYYSARLLIHSEYMGLLTPEEIEEELQEYPPNDWLAMEEEALLEERLALHELRGGSDETKS